MDKLIVVHPGNQSEMAELIAFLEDRKMVFEEEKDIYSEEFNAKMKRVDDDILAGRGVKMNLDDIWK
ncbi:MAG: DUF2683 family protein [Bacteroidota bacterium]